MTQYDTVDTAALQSDILVCDMSGFCILVILDHFLNSLVH